MTDQKLTGNNSPITIIMMRHNDLIMIDNNNQ